MCHYEAFQTPIKTDECSHEMDLKQTGGLFHRRYFQMSQ